MKRAAAAVTALLLGGIIMFGFFGCSGEKYRVDYDGHKDFFEGAKDSYRAGEHVRIYYTIIATDTDYSFYLDGESLSPDYSDRKGERIVSGDVFIPTQKTDEISGGGRIGLG